MIYNSLVSTEIILNNLMLQMIHCHILTMVFLVHFSFNNQSINIDLFRIIYKNEKNLILYLFLNKLITT